MGKRDVVGGRGVSASANNGLHSNGVSGNDFLTGGPLDDMLVGGGGSDVVSGGAGSDFIVAGGHDDRVDYSWSENLGPAPEFADLGAKDVYNGGGGYDTLVLRLTYGEAAAAAQDIVNYEAFLASHAGHGRPFQFTTFDLRVQNFDALVIELINTAPTAAPDAGATDEDTLLQVTAAVGVLANDSDPDHLDVFRLVGSDATSQSGAVVQVNADGSYSYDPRTAAALQALAEDEVDIDSFTYAIADRAGAQATGTVEITVTGVNDAPEIAGETFGAEVEELGSNADIGALAAGGSFYFDDLDLTDTHSLNTAGAATNLGTLEATITDPATGAGDGTVSWNYAVNAAAVAYLAQGEVKLEDFTVTVTDDAMRMPLSDAAGLRVTIVGTNDAPLIQDGVRSGAVTERADETPDENIGHLTASGSIAFGDVDLRDTHTTTATFVSATDSVIGPTSERGTLTAGVSNPSAGDGQGELSWTLAVGASELDHLAQGQSVTQVYELAVTDDFDAVDTAQVSVVLAGVNDAVVITSGPQAGDVAEDLQLGALGTIAFDDVDLIDEHTVTFVPADGNTGLGEFALFALAEDPTTRSGSVQWRYTLDNAAAQFLAQGQTVTETYVVNVTDPHGSSHPQDVAITIVGTNDAPIIIDTQTDAVGAVAEAAEPAEGGPRVDGGVIVFADVDALDTHTAGFVELGTGYRGTFSVGTPDTTSDMVSWSFSVDDSALDDLAEGQTLTQRYEVAIDDRNAVVTKTVEISITGANDAPTIAAAGTDASGEVTEAAEPHSDSGVIAFDDVDTLDTHSARFDAQGASYRGTFALGSLGHDADTLAWSFAVDDSGLEDLAHGQTVTQLYDVTVSDGHVGGTATQTVQITLTGENDAPAIIAAATDALGALTEAAEASEGGTLTDSGTIAFADVDSIDLHAATFLAQGSEGYRGTFVLGDLDNDLDTVEWTFSVDDPALDDLGAGEVLTQLYDVTIGDGNSGSATQTVTITINGTNDAPDAVNDAHSMFEDTVAIIDVLKNDTDTDGDALTVSALGAAQNGSVALNADGTVTYTPNADFFGTDSFTYDIKDGNGGTDTATVNVAIANVSEPGGGGGGGGNAGNNSIVPSAELSNPLEYYVHFSGAGFGSTWQRLESFSVGVTTLLQSGGDGKLDAALAKADGATLVLGSSGAVPLLADALAEGLPLKIEVEAIRAGSLSRPALMDQYVFDGVQLTGLRLGQRAGDSDHVLSFDFDKLHHAVPSLGEKAPEGKLGWDFSKDAATSTGAAEADVSLAALEGASEDLDYYLRLEGGNWMRLEAFELNLEAQQSSIGDDKLAVSDLKLSDFSVQVGSSTELLKLTQTLLDGNVKDLEIAAFTPGKGAAALVDQFRFEGVQLTGLQSANTVDNDLTLQLSGKYSHAHADASKANLDTEFGWDFAKDQSFTPPDASGTLDPAKVTPSAELSNPLEYYVHFSGAGFGSTWQRLESFSVGVTTLLQSGGDGKLDAALAKADGATLVLGSSGAVPLLADALAEGLPLKIEVEAIRAGSLSRPALMDQYVFDGVQLTGLRLGQRAGDSDHVLSFDFDKLHHAVPSLGEKAPEGKLGWDFSKDAATSTGAAEADVSLAALEGASEDLDYYLRLEGGNWMRLEAFELNLEAQQSSIGDDKLAVSDLKLSDFSVQVGSSTELLKLTQTLLDGNVKDLEIAAFTPGKGAAALVDQFRFEGVQLTGLQSANTVDNDLTLQLSGKYSHAHADASKANLDTEFGWDFAKDQSFTPPDASGTLDPAKVTPSAELSNPLEYYVHFSGAGFGSTWQRLESFSVGVTTLLQSGGDGKLDAALAKADGATLVLGSSGAVPLLADALAEGLPLKIEVEAIRAGSLSRPALMDQYVFDGVQLTGLRLGQRAGDSDHVLSFDFDKLHHAVPSLGEKAPEGKLGWDFSKDAATSTGAAEADVSLAALEGASEDLDYYLRLEGGNWMRLEAFELNLEAQQSSIGDDKLAVSDLKLSDFSVQVGSSTELLKLTQTLLDGNVKDLEIEAYTAAKGALLVDEFRFENVLLRSLQSANTVDNDLTLQLSGKYSHAHADASKANLDTEFGWDFGKGAAFSAPAPNPDVDFS